ncbi:hypothetical protein D3OALGB2SA_1161 [Olavius algarvensis associated proteobacterium Delta 3]|nr:hypothetical protein D3OALGB2SA_1161 [Olavius algarvensis associated proteobacterium Delta 3]
MVSKNPKQPNVHLISSRLKSLWFPIAVIIAVIVAVAIGGPLLVSDNRTSTSNETPGVAPGDDAVRSTPSKSVRARFQKLVGRWRRPDGGYILEINSVDPAGKLQASYYTPRPINVSLAYAAQEEDYARVYVELRDVGYPGATYSLTYHKEQDAFAGHYHQPAAEQTYRVIFLRQKEKGVKP